MAGQFAHICLVNSACTPEGLDSIVDLMPSVRSALEGYRPFCRLGAVSPDCPAVVGSTDATGWNSVMHYVRPSDFVRDYGIPKVLQMSFSTTEARACIAWLFGYVAHLVADYTIHPIVMELVGPYSNKKNRSAHRRCELDQDAYIFFDRIGHEILGTDFLEFTGLAECGVKGNTHKLNLAIADMWAYCLRQYPRPETKDYVRLPSMSLLTNNWFATYVNAMENIATKNNYFTRLFGVAYRKSDHVDKRYIENLPIPNSSSTIGYVDLFESTRKNVIQAWTWLAQALKYDDAGLFKLANGNLDTGMDSEGKYIYWS